MVLTILLELRVVHGRKSAGFRAIQCAGMRSIERNWCAMLGGRGKMFMEMYRDLSPSQFNPCFEVRDGEWQKK